MKAQMSFDELGHQSVQRSTAGGDELQNVFALTLLFEGSFDSVYLSPYPADSGQELLFVFGGMGHGRPFVSKG
jgi:hypothetical protein